MVLYSVVSYSMVWSCMMMYKTSIHTICIDLAWAIMLVIGKQALQTLVGSSSPYCGNIICTQEKMSKLRCTMTFLPYETFLASIIILNHESHYLFKTTLCT